MGHPWEFYVAVQKKWPGGALFEGVTQFHVASMLNRTLPFSLWFPLIMHACGGVMILPWTFEKIEPATIRRPIII